MIEKESEKTFPCPSCQKELTYLSRVKVMVFADEGFQYDRHPTNTLEDNYEGRTQSFKCPQCYVVLQCHYEIALRDVTVIGQGTQPTSPAPVVRGTLTKNELELLDACRANGMVDVFAQVVKEQTHVDSRPPQDIDRYFITFLRIAVRDSSVAQPILKEFIKEFPGRIEVWKAQGIVMVVSDGRICRFVPKRAMNMEKTPKSLQVHGTTIDRGVTNYKWIKKTTLGYVPPDAQIFLESLRHSLGDRGREMRPVPLRPR